MNAYWQNSDSLTDYIGLTVFRLTKKTRKTRLMYRVMTLQNSEAEKASDWWLLDWSPFTPLQKDPFEPKPIKGNIQGSNNSNREFDFLRGSKSREEDNEYQFKLFEGMTGKRSQWWWSSSIEIQFVLAINLVKLFSSIIQRWVYN